MATTKSELSHKSCFKCGYEADTAAKVCPQCGKVLRSSTNVRVRGAIVTICGLFLVLMMGGIGGFLGYIFTGGSINGTHADLHKIGQTDLLMIAAVLGMVAIVGFAAIVNGGYMLVSGRRNKILTWIMLFFVFVLVIASAALTIFLK